MNFLRKLTKIILTKQILGTAIVICVAFILVAIINSAISKVLVTGKNSFEVKKRKSIIKLFQSIIKYIIWMIGILIILDFYGVDTQSLIASIGIAGVVLGLALQDTVKDFISGISLILENYLQVGDVVTYNDFTGEVIELGLRTTKIKSFDGQVLVVANRNIDTIINASQKKANLLLNIPTSYEEKVPKVEKVLTSVINDAINEKLIFEDSKYLGVNELGAHSVEYLINIHCDQNKRYEVRRAMLKKVLLAYEKNNIKIPYNQIEVHHGQDL